MNRCISVDWLTMYCENTILVSNCWYFVEKQPYSTAQFADVYKVYDKITKEHYCTIQKKPHSKIIPEHATMVKLANRQLYKSDWNHTLNSFFLCMNITPLSISRIDIACDFNRFDNNLHPESLIKGFITNKYVRCGKGKYTLIGSQDLDHKFEYLRFGSRESEISTYLYNKTKELNEVHDKPYIRDRWVTSGLNTEQDVWRLEVSLRTVQMRTIVKMTGEVIRLDLDFLKTQGILENVYNCAILKSFDFRHNDGQLKKSRMKRVSLFKGLSTTLEMKTFTNKANTGRMDKIVLNRLARHFEFYRNESEQMDRDFNTVIQHILDSTGLEKYYKEKVVPNIGKFTDR